MNHSLALAPKTWLFMWYSRLYNSHVLEAQQLPRWSTASPDGAPAPQEPHACWTQRAVHVTRRTAGSCDNSAMRNEAKRTGRQGLRAVKVGIKVAQYSGHKIPTS